MTHGDDPETEPEADQTAVIAFLADPATHAGTHLSSETVDRFDTHGNLVFLAGCDAWKIKRAVRFPYMDFSTLEKRREACAREVAINRRLAPGIYLGCVPITRSSDGKLAIGGDGEAVEWAVHMRRFGQADLLVTSRRRVACLRILRAPLRTPSSRAIAAPKSSRRPLGPNRCGSSPHP